MTRAKHERDESTSSNTNSAKRTRLTRASSPDSASSSAQLEGAAKFREFSASLPTINRSLIHAEMPQRILALQTKLCDYPPFEHALPLPSEGHVAPISTPIDPHALIAASLLPLLHSETTAFLRLLSSVKLGIQLSIPAVDENNFSSEIQEEAINELTRYEDLHYNTLERILGYHSNRAKVASKICKYPGIVDYYHAVRELDENAHLDVRMTLTEIRNHYIILHDLLLKNEEKLKGDNLRHHMTV